MSRSPVMMVLAVLGCSPAAQRSGSLATKASDTTSHSHRDSLITIAALQKALADHAALVNHAWVTADSVAGAIGATVSVDADRLTILQGDSAVTQYYVSFRAGSLDESVSEFEVASLLRGIDSVISQSSRTTQPNMSQDITYRTSGGLTVGASKGYMGGPSAYLKASGRYAFIEPSRLTTLRSAIVKARDSIAALKRR